MSNPADSKGGWVWQDKFDTALTVVAGGFGLLSSLLAFFGVRDGRLDQMVRNEPTFTLLVCTLVGIGVALALVTPAISMDTKPGVWCALIAGFMAPTLVHFFAPSSSDPMADWSDKLGPIQVIILIVGIVIVGLAAYKYFRKRTWLVPAPVLGLVLSVVFVGAGLYGAAKAVVSGLRFRMSRRSSRVLPTAI